MTTQTSTCLPPSGYLRIVSFLIAAIALAGGLTLSFVSWLELCSEQCAASHEYRLFGFSFSILGILFFAGLNILYALSWIYPWLLRCVGWVIAGAIGAEMKFIAVQKYEIGHWCPVCVSIAACVAVAGMALSFEYYRSNRGKIMHPLKKVLPSCLFLIAGFLTALIGVSNPNSAEATSAEMQERLAFGKKSSPVVVYFFSDWYCPSCKKVEPIIEKLFPKIRSQAAFYFVDYPIHKKSMNFVPYNLSFLIYNKGDYFQARDALMQLTKETESPNDEDVAKAAQKYHVSFRELSYLDVKTGMDYFDGLVAKYNVNSTPTMILTNTHNNKIIKLDGSNEITEDEVLKALEKLKPQ